MNRFAKTALAATLSIGTIAGSTSAFAWGPGPVYVIQPQPQVVVSQAACDNYATAYANANVGNRARPVVIGTLIGAGAGALLGGFGFGAPLAGAAIGAGVGALGGVAVGNPAWNNAYGAAFQACMQGYYI